MTKTNLPAVLKVGTPAKAGSHLVILARDGNSTAGSNSSNVAVTLRQSHTHRINECLTRYNPHSFSARSAK